MTKKQTALGKAMISRGFASGIILAYSLKILLIDGLSTDPLFADSILITTAALFFIYSFSVEKKLSK